MWAIKTTSGGGEGGGNFVGVYPYLLRLLLGGGGGGGGVQNLVGLLVIEMICFVMTSGDCLDCDV